MCNICDLLNIVWITLETYLYFTAFNLLNVASLQDTYLQ